MIFRRLSYPNPDMGMAVRGGGLCYTLFVLRGKEIGEEYCLPVISWLWGVFLVML